MVKLKVQARVLPESEYDTVTGSSRIQGRKFIVIVRNPEEWFIGTLAQEVSRTYQRMYKHPLGEIKYLKDRDDCDLDPEQLVSDVLLDEGRAATDGHDQEAVFVVIQEQGHPVRHDSVIPDLTPVHYQTRPRPPPPKFPGLTSSLGKRSYGETNDASRNADKRSKLVEISETQDQAIPTIERSPELIRNTQHETEDEDVFDDAEESHEHSTSANPSSTGVRLPQTPSSGALANGYNSSTASKFKSSGRKEIYAPAESDIEDSQMSPRRDGVRAPEREAMQAIEAKLSQRSHNDDAVSAFDAQKALQPTDVEDPIASSGSVPTKFNSENGEVEAIGQKSSSEEASDAPKSARPPSADSKGRRTSTSPVKASTTSASSGGATKDHLTVNPTKKAKRLQSENVTKPTVNDKKKQKVPGAKLNGLPKAALSLSPSRRTSGVISELDSPGEQLSQSLWDSAQGGSVAESVKNVLEGKNSSGFPAKEQKRKGKPSQDQSPSSASILRPSSSADLSKTSTETQANQKMMHETPQQPLNSQKESTSRYAKTKSLAEKIQEVRAAAVKDSTTAGKTSNKDASKSAVQAIVDKSKAPESATPAAKSSQFLPDLGTGSKGSNRGASVNVKPALIVPPGMTEAEYLAMRARHEATPQPSKSTTSLKKKKEASPARNETEPAATAKTKTPITQKRENPPPNVSTKAPTAAKSVVETVKNAFKTAPNVAKSAIQQNEDSSSSDDETGTSSEESESEGDVKPKTAESKLLTKSTSTSKSPPAGRQSNTTSAIRYQDKEAMPPPTPNSTAKRRGETRTQRVSPAVSKNDSSEKSSRSTSKSQSPAIVPTATPAKANILSSSSKKTAPPTATKTSAKLPEQPVSKLKALRQKLHSEAASKDSSPAPSSAKAKKKPLPIETSSSESESSDDSSSSSDDIKKTAVSKGSKVMTPLARPDPTIRDVTPESSDDSDDSD